MGPLTAPFFLAYGLTRATYIGTEAASALAMYGAKIAAYGAGALLDGRVLLFGLALTPAALLGAWAGRRTVGRISDRLFVGLVEAGLIVAGLMFLIGF
ncbi:TSUP family transporter [Micromonospora chalcea]|uniref:TSUP family transporter n=1 Tax=Micromonospora chalcea TaxID=1874 RepID=UPI00341DADBC